MTNEEIELVYGIITIVIAIPVGICLLGLIDFLLFYFTFKDMDMSEEELKQVAKGWKGDFDDK